MRKYMSKRQRPCDFCRSRKTACRIDQSPPCRACALSGKDCTFLQDAPPRKRPEGHESIQPNGSPSGQSRSPEDAGFGGDGRYADLFSNPMHGQDDAVQQMLYNNSEDMISGLHMDLDVSNYSFLPGLSPIGTQEAQPSNAQQGQLTTAASPLQTIDQMEDGCPQVIGLSSDMDPFVLHHYDSDESGFFHFKQLSIHSVQSHPYPVQFLTSRRSLVAKSRDDNGEQDIDDAQLKSELEAIVAPSTGKRLLSLFRTYIEPQYPIFSSEARPNPESSPVHLLAAAYAIAFPFSIYDDQLCIDLAYDSPPYPDLSRLINLSLRPEMHSPTISVAQTQILLLLRPFANPLVAEAPYKGTLMGSLAATAVTLGLHLDASVWNIPTWQIALRRRLSFVIYCLDKWLAASLGRPRQLRDDDWIVTSLVVGDRVGCELSDSDWEYLMFTSELTATLDSALSRLFSLRASQHIAHNPDYALPVVEELSNSLPDLADNQARSGNALTTLEYLGYQYVKLLIVRAVSRPAANRATDASYSNVDPISRNMLRNAALEFVSFVQSIRTDDAQVFWPPWCPTVFSTLCFTLLSAVVTSRDENEAAEWLAILQKTRRDLRLKATTLPVLRLGLLRIDAVFWRGLDKVLRLEPHVQTAVQAALGAT